MSFDSLVEEIMKLSIDEKEELKFLIERFLVEEQRENIYENYIESLEEFTKGKLEFSSDVDELRKKIE